MINIIRIILIINILIFTLLLKANNSNEILFSINNDIYTTIDLENRKNYVWIKEESIIDDLKGIKKDYISVLLFDYFNKDKNIVNNLEEFVEEKFDIIKNEYSKNEKEKKLILIFNKLSHDVIKENIKLDLQRKFIIDNELNNKRDLIFRDNIDEINNIYDIEINLISIDKNNINSNILEKLKKYNIENFSNFINFL